MYQQGKLIVIEGLDGSGKATQAALLVSALQHTGLQVLPISFPDYESQSSALVRMYLAGEVGEVGAVNAYAASSFYSADRYISYRTGWMRQYGAGQVIIADRYTTSNAVHQMSKLPKEEWEAYLEWLWDFEFSRMSLPAPDLVIYLDMHPGTSRMLLEKRYAQSGGHKDIHEADMDYLVSCREAALYAARRLDWKILRCCDGHHPLPIEDISGQVEKIARELLDI